MNKAAITVEPICAFNDNYIWLIGASNGLAYIVDPGDAQPVLDTLAARKLTLGGILLTHWHPDHTGGVKELKRLTGCVVWGPYNDAIEGIDHRVTEGDVVSLPGLTLDIFTVPGHTLDHIAYCGDGLLFCGDTLFVGGCGRVFEGTFPMMRASLEKLRSLPPETRVFCAHEYTEANLRFAKAADPDNPALHAHAETCQGLRRDGHPTVPSTLGIEAATNPFLRWDNNALAQGLFAAGRCQSTTPDEVFRGLRTWKDTF